MAGSKMKDITGQRFGRLTVLRVAEEKTGSLYRWWVQCDCGAPEKTVLGNHLRLGRIVSCGCHSRDRIRAALTTHGLSDRPEYHCWVGMCYRCTSPNDASWPYYGGRGIRVCERWLMDTGFANFLADVGPRPSLRHTIDRIDNDGHYEPGNVRWATKTEQNRNSRKNVRLTFRGETLTIAEWSERTGIPYRALQTRVVRGWSTDRALTHRVQPRRRSRGTIQ